MNPTEVLQEVDTPDNELEKVIINMAETMGKAMELLLKERRRSGVSALDELVFRTAKEKVLVNLLYYDRVIRFLEEGISIPTWKLPELYPLASHEDWTKAFKEASRLFVHFLKNRLILN